MFVKNIEQIAKCAVTGDGIKDVDKQVPIGSEQGWNNTLRVFSLKPGGHTPKHSHDWEHVNYVISGSGTLEIDGQKNQMTKGSFAFVPPNATHQYSNDANATEQFVMICIIPDKATY